MKISYIFNKQIKLFFKKWRKRGYGIFSSFILSQFDFHNGLIERNKKLFWDVTMGRPYKKSDAIKIILKNKGSK